VIAPGAAFVTLIVMSDVEHEFVVENQNLRDEAAQLRSVAERALRAAIAAQDARTGSHEPWLDEALRALPSGIAADRAR
jgi:hypothetical protein